MDLSNLIEKANLKAVEIFHHLHMHPELSEMEKETADFICQTLDNLKIPYQRNVAGHGIIGLISGKGDGCIGIRADIDALPVTETTNLPYKSQNCGVMHACGHDMHISILLGTAMVLKEMADTDKLPGSVKLFFQPSEETIGGADAMIKAGAMENPKVSTTLGLHVDPALEVGSLLLCKGAMNAAVDDFSCTVQGKQSHGAKPENGVDPIVVAADIIMSLQTIASRMTSPTNPVVITIGQLNAGAAPNIIPDKAVMTGTLRALSNETLDFIRKKTELIAETTASMYDASVDFSWMNAPFPPLINDGEVTRVLEQAAENCPHIDQVVYMPEPSMGADDYAFFTQAAPGAYFNVGCTKKGGQWYPLHNPNFAAEEETIICGIEIEVNGALALLGK